MKKSDLKKILKPIVKECIIESLVEEGILSSVISEVMRGVQPTISKPAQAPLKEKQAPRRKEKDSRLNEYRAQMQNAVNADAYNGVNLFEGTTPVAAQSSPSSDQAAGSPLANIDPGDPGLDISQLFNGVSDKWKHLV